MRFVVAALMTSQMLSAAPYLMYVGTYTTKDSKGIYAWRFDPKDGKATALGLVAETPSPSWLAWNADKHVIYAANELSDYQGQKSGAVSAWDADRATGKLKQLSIAPTRGDGPCHVAMDNGGKFVYAANYGGGSVVRYPVKLDGSLGESDKFIQHQPIGAAKPHAHQITIAPDGKSLLVADLGLDQVITYDLDLNRLGEVTGKQGAGPRHLALHPSHKYAYVINELASSVTTFDYDGRKLTPRGTLSSLPKGFTGKDSSAEITVHPSGKFLYASNRGADTIAMFRIGKDGALSEPEQFPSGGKGPRNFAIDPTGKWMLVANQNTDNIVIYHLDGKSGKLTASGTELKASMPVSILFIR